MNIRFTKANEEALTPHRANAFDAGYDLVATSVKRIGLFKWKVDSGIKVEIPNGYCGLLFSRSSIHKNGVIQANSVGVIDAPYRGTISTVFYGLRCGYKVGDKFAQLIISTAPAVNWKEVKQLSASERGEGGYGSTGR